MRSLAAFVARTDPTIFAVTEIDAGDALAIATRFELQWGYRGGQALFWKSPFQSARVYDAYLPFSPARPFERRGILRVAMQADDTPLTVVATQIGTQRDQRIRELRALRTALRKVEGACLVFCIFASGKIDLHDLGLARATCRGTHDEAIYTRGFTVTNAHEDTASHRGIGTPTLAQIQLA